jgi:hypothetical protein
MLQFVEQRNQARPDPNSHFEEYKEWFRQNDGMFRWRFFRDVEKIHDEMTSVHIDDPTLDELIERHKKYFASRQQNVQAAVEHPQMFHLSIEDIRIIGQRFKFLATQVPH